MENLPADQYNTQSPSACALIETIRDNARNLSDAIKAANEAGISVGIIQAPVGSESLVHVVFTF